MEIEEIINKWFEKTENELQALGLPKNKLDVMILSARPVVSNYIDSALLVLDKERQLPAMALLRITGELIAKLIYCLKDSNSKGQDSRIQRWEKTTFKECETLCKSIIERFKGHERAQVQEWINEIEKKLDGLQKVKHLPPTNQILEAVFEEGHPVGKFGMYQKYLNSVHIDLETLAKTIKRDTTGTEYMGDVEYNIEDLKFECLTHVYIFFREVYMYYNLDFQEIQNEYKILIPKS